MTDLRIEEEFRNLERNAKDIGMKINKKKTQLLVVSPPNGCLMRAELAIGGGETIKSQETLKLVGFTFGRRPGVRDHVDSIGDRFWQKVWMLHHLRRAGFRGQHLYRLYCCYLRTIVEFCSVVYHSLLTKGQEEYLEGLHRNAVRICFGFEAPVDETMTKNGIKTLRARRLRRCNSFIQKATRNPRFQRRWFPLREAGPQWLRNRRAIREERAMMWRRFNSPLSFIRRRANELGIMPEY